MRSTFEISANRSHRFGGHGRPFAILWAAAFLLASVFCVSAHAQTDLNGENKSITPPTDGADWSTSFTNTSENLSTITFSGLASGTRYDFTKTLTGNIHVDVTHQGYANNENRFTFSNAGNTFTGGVTMREGILFVTNANQVPSFAGGLTLENTVIMNSAEATFNNSLYIPEGKFAGLRSSTNLTYAGEISGSGDLVIVTENKNKVTLTGTNNTYSGVTSIGTV